MKKAPSALRFLAAAVLGSLMFSILLTDEWSYSPPYSLEHYDSQRQLQQRDEEISDPKKSVASPGSTSRVVNKYSFEDTLRAKQVYRNDFLVVIYDPESDTFIPYYSDTMKRSHMAKTFWAYHYMIGQDTLRHMFPERFNPSQPEFAMAIGGGDYPNLKSSECLMKQSGPCVGDNVGPVLQFGSVYKGPMFPNVIAMPMPVELHLKCFAQHLRGLRGCPQYQHHPRKRSLVFGEKHGLYWENLIPQVVWRGTDFTYLTNLYIRMENGVRIGHPLRQPFFDVDIEPQLSKNARLPKAEAAVNALRKVYDQLLPRWKGAVLTAEAELESKKTTNGNDNTTTLPWVNIKFSRGRNNDDYAVNYDKLEEVGIHALGEYMSLEELGKYKYHIDLGGGGGTTWTGTVQKLALPGLLFHHETPTKDYIADWIEPWKHYVPVRADLKDLKERYEWAENNPGRAKVISDNATRLIRSLGTRDGFEPFFNKFYRDPLRDVIEAYQPLPEGQSWRDVISKRNWMDMVPTSDDVS